MNAAAFQEIAPSIPHQPGIYKYFDASGQLLYVGKAKDLRKRVGSYFSKTLQSYKTAELVNRIKSIEYVVVNTEQDAFLLENTLIKQHKPVFNIELKDDKTYPYIVIKKEPFPRVFLTRRKLNDGATYLGPFTSVGKVRELLAFIKQNIPLRTCKLPLTEYNIQKGKFKVCLEYHLGNCKGPCAGLQTQTDYLEDLAQVKNILSGKLAPVMQHMKSAMQQYVTNMEFEKAAQIKKKIEHLEKYQVRSAVVNPKMGDVDVCSILVQEQLACVNFMMVRGGAITASENISFTAKLADSEKDILAFAISYFRDRFESTAEEVVTPFEIEILEAPFSIKVPKLGEKKTLLSLSEKNAAFFATEQIRKKKLLLNAHSEAAKENLLPQLQADLHLATLPTHIECFDNSNFQGSYPVAAMVCFREGMPSKKEYRHYNIKTVTGINDFASMKEVVYRRYKRLLEEGSPLPQLVIIDGGKGQLSAANESIRALGLEGKMTVVGLAKNVEEIFFTGDSESLKLPYKSSSLMLIRSIRDEVHRFGVQFHRQKRSRGTFKNEIASIKGIGKATAENVLKHFKSIQNVEAASLSELATIAGLQKAKLIQLHFENKKQD